MFETAWLTFIFLPLQFTWCVLGRIYELLFLSSPSRHTYLKSGRMLMHMLPSLSNLVFCLWKSKNTSPKKALNQFLLWWFQHSLYKQSVVFHHVICMESLTHENYIIHLPHLFQNFFLLWLGSVEAIGSPVMIIGWYWSMINQKGQGRHWEDTAHFSVNVRQVQFMQRRFKILTF